MQSAPEPLILLGPAGPPWLLLVESHKAWHIGAPHGSASWRGAGAGLMLHGESNVR